MERNEKKIIIFIIIAVVGGLIITIITSFLEIQTTMMLGSQNYGFPLAWRSVPVVLNPTETYHIPFLILDVVFWGFITFGLIFLINYIISKR